jgi:hypothetical protein
MPFYLEKVEGDDESLCNCNMRPNEGLHPFRLQCRLLALSATVIIAVFGVVIRIQDGISGLLIKLKTRI